jgi:hypothetical protein
MISFSFFVIAYRFYNTTLYGDSDELWCSVMPTTHGVWRHRQAVSGDADELWCPATPMSCGVRRRR